MPPAKKAVTSENTGQSEDAVSVVAKKPAKKVAKKSEIIDLVPETLDDPIAKINQDKVMVYMQRGHSYSSPEVFFTKEKPFQLMNPIDAARLISGMSDRFVYATKQQVENFYSLG